MDGVLVVKLGGGLDPGRTLDNVAALHGAGTHVVLVHGGGAEADRLAGQLNRPVRAIEAPDGTRSRRTDEEALDVLAMALLGRVKPALVGGLRARGVCAAGLCGADGALLTAERKTAIRSRENGRVRLIRDDRAGRVTRVAPAILRTLLTGGLLPVVSPPAADEEGRLLNVDADQVAAAIATALGADALVLLTDVPGVLRDPADPASVMARLDCSEPEQAAVGGRMRHKVRAAVRAGLGGVRHVVIGHGGIDSPVDSALNGAGTLVVGTRRVGA